MPKFLNPIRKSKISNGAGKGISTPLAITIIIVLAVVLFGGALAYQYLVQLKEQPSLPEIKAPEDETANWETYRDEENKFEFKYPKELEKNYINTHPHEWPPKVTVRSIDPNFVCEDLESVKTPLGYGKQKKVTVNNTEYCVLTMGEGAMGMTYSSYIYTTNKDNKQLALEFGLSFVSCGALSGINNKMEECNKEQKSFDPNILADKIISTFRFID